MFLQRSNTVVQCGFSPEVNIGTSARGDSSPRAGAAVGRGRGECLGEALRVAVEVLSLMRQPYDVKALMLRTVPGGGRLLGLGKVRTAGDAGSDEPLDPLGTALTLCTTALGPPAFSGGVLEILASSLAEVFATNGVDDSVIVASVALDTLKSSEEAIATTSEGKYFREVST